MKKHLEIFRPLMDLLTGENVAIAGIHSLKAHGLMLSREAADLDVVIFSPTSQQMRTLEKFDFFRVKVEGETHYPVEAAVSVKFQKSGLTIDFLLEHGKPTPEDLLYYAFEGTYYKVQNIKNTIDAKRSFKRKDGGHRYKDVADFLDLKTKNFNLED